MKSFQSPHHRLVLLLEADGGPNFTPMRVNLSPAQVAAYVDDPAATFEKVTGIPDLVHWQWVRDNGRVQCERTTSRGCQCRNMVPGFVALSEFEAALKAGGICGPHDAVTPRRRTA